MNDFVSRIKEYGRTHPDFAPVLAKYGLKPTAPAAAPVAPAFLPPTALPKK